MKKWLANSIAVEFISALLILLFVYTAVSKIFEGPRFAGALSKSTLIADYATTLAVALPAVELVIALFLLSPRWRTLGLYASAFIMTVFTMYLAYMIIFAPTLPCTCGGVLRQLSWNQHLVFNSGFTMLAGLGIYLQTKGANDDKDHSKQNPVAI
ncbi:MAG TPA: MauE/DoxX family redox-associated membrane protein [Chitinophagaceae bacterium]